MYINFMLERCLHGQCLDVGSTDPFFDVRHSQRTGRTGLKPLGARLCRREAWDDAMTRQDSASNSALIRTRDEGDRTHTTRTRVEG